MLSNGRVPLPLLCVLIATAVLASAKHHHGSRHKTERLEDVNGDNKDSGGEVKTEDYCMKNDRNNFAWANTTMDIQYTKTVKVETSKDSTARTDENMQQTQERHRRSTETPAEKKRRKKKEKKARRARKQQQKAEATTSANGQAERRRRASYRVPARRTPPAHIYPRVVYSRAKQAVRG